MNNEQKQELDRLKEVISKMTGLDLKSTYIMACGTPEELAKAIMESEADGNSQYLRESSGVETVGRNEGPDSEIYETFMNLNKNIKGDFETDEKDIRLCNSNFCIKYRHSPGGNEEKMAIIPLKKDGLKRGLADAILQEKYEVAEFIASKIRFIEKEKDNNI